MLFQLLLPLVAICFVLAILKININPTSPSIVLSFKDLLQQDPVIVASPPQHFASCLVDARAGAAHDACPACLTFRCMSGANMYYSGLLCPASCLQSCLCHGEAVGAMSKTLMMIDAHEHACIHLAMPAPDGPLAVKTKAQLDFLQGR